MREIKFRAWDKKDGMMYVDVHEGITFEDESHYSFADFINNSGYHEFELMQYTGLKTTDGKEIFEGDVINAHQRSGRGFRTPDEIYTLCEIVWRDGNFRAKRVGRLTYYDLGLFDEIFWLGNIYETPELMP